MFIRKLVGLDRQAAMEAFGEFLHNEGLDGVFGDDGATRIVHLLQEIELRAAA
jgi:hypothetical protein